MVTIDVDGRRYQVEAGQNLLQACLSLGLNLPYFCWHPALGSVGACRQCAVTQYMDADDNRGRLAMACMTPVSDGLRISLQNDAEKAFRSGIIETLMSRHPHDCPVCEEGGDCHLQDMTVMSGHHRRRYRGAKRTFHNQQLGPLVRHEMNRCITCFRCVRFYRDYAGGHDLHAMGSRDRTYFGRVEDGNLESPFAGNLVEVCPTGVFTDKPHGESYSRKWDLQSAPAICVHCSLGCNISPGARYGRLKRVQNRYHPDINGYFLCDRGRYGFRFTDPDRRLLQALQRTEEGEETLSTGNALSRLWHRIKQADQHLIGIGSPRASLEANFALRQIVGAKNFYAGVSAVEDEMVRLVLQLMYSGVRSASLREVEQADAILILGEDLIHTAPRMALSVRQAVRNNQRRQAEALHIPLWQDQAVRNLSSIALSPCFITSSYRTGLDEVASGLWRNSPQSQTLVADLIANKINEIPSLSKTHSEGMQTWAIMVADALKQARKPLIIAGCSTQYPALLAAAGRIMTALKSHNPAARSAFVLPECNSLGLALLTDNDHENRLEDAFDAAAQGKNHLILLENDLYQRAAPQQVDQFIGQLGELTLLDYQRQRTFSKADLVLPVTPFSESGGTLINNEGRAQYYFAAQPPAPGTMMSWHWLWESRHEARPVDENALHLLQQCAASDPPLARLTELLKQLDLSTADGRLGYMQLPRKSQRYSGRTAIDAADDVREPALAQDAQSLLSFDMEGVPPTQVRDLQLSRLLPMSWYPGWNSGQSVHKFMQEYSDGRPGSGVLMLQPAADHESDLTTLQPDTEVQQTSDQSLTLVPRHYLFGSDPLSMDSPPVASLAPSSCLMLHPEDAQRRGLNPHDLVRLESSRFHLELPIKTDNTLAPGVAAIPWNLPDQPWLPLPQQVELVVVQRSNLIARDGEEPADG
ncbi:NADH-quinone oxidoreductase subunit NuoG [Marinobacterium jannaschii]|uniref:NADH-quinone oxidoreductase subunit NuoG n=1 Tax=Marinobacterium jannaschii TaxID=64970 RepID=UPI000AF4DCEE|nr:NADH-quinone oxidoreductase subunit NuoG [Marinobacterium jannaschii]